MKFRDSFAIFVVCLLLAACSRRPVALTPVAPPEPSPSAAPQMTPAPVEATPAKQSWFSRSSPTPPPPAAIWKEFSGDKAFAHVKRMVELGPRPSGAAALEQTRKQIVESLTQSGWKVTRQAFSAATPRGAVEFVNLIARFPGEPRRHPEVIVASHYDTKIFDTIQFVGASDGASSTGALLELARVLALDPAMASRVELVFFDGEEAVSQYSETDGLYGSRYFVNDLKKTGEIGQFKFGILWDMIGDKDLTITLSPDSPAQLARGILEAADALKLRNHFSYFSRSIWDDHSPLNEAGIPTIDLIDFDYIYWHTADDTLDKLSPESLQKVGAVTLYYLRKQLTP